MKTKPQPPAERVSSELNALLDVLDRLTPALEERDLLPTPGETWLSEPAEYVSADELLTTARAIWTRAYHPPKHERKEEPELP